jgi:cell fate regulator YaaT (PSP1 superfamily)
VANVVGIRFPTGAKTYCFKAAEMELLTGERVVVESELGISIGTVSRTTCEPDCPEDKLRPVLRKVTAADLNQEEENEGVRQEANRYCKERIQARGLEMKLITTDVTLDRKRFIFYFTADSRIDFRELVKDLASKFRTRIELRQIGVRDAAKILGGHGVCGKEVCCKTWLRGFSPISIKMAKQQELVLNTCKLSGLCGRLLCCLNYEYDEGAKGKRKKKKAVAPEAKPEMEAVAQAEEVREPEVVVPAPEAPQAAAPAPEPARAEQAEPDASSERRHFKKGRRSRRSRAARKAKAAQDGREKSQEGAIAQASGTADAAPKEDQPKKGKRRRRRRRKKPGGSGGPSGGSGGAGGSGVSGGSTQVQK